MTVVDVIIILLLLSAVIRGTQAGMLQLVLSSAGFIGGLLLGSWVSRRIAAYFVNPFSKFIIVLVLVFGLAVLLGLAGEFLSYRLRRYAHRWRLGKANEWAGAVVEVALTLAVVWLVAPALANISSYHIGHDVKKSLIIRNLDTILPRPPNVFAPLEKIISPNGFPDVFLGLEPQHTTVSPTNHVNNQAVIKAESSMVKVQGAGCGGLVFGSGFVVAKGIIVTNAHVVAGIKQPEVVDRFNTYKATPIYFDPNLDIAILRVNGLNDPPLKLNGQILPDSDAAATLGFPAGGPLVAQDAAIIDHVTAVGSDIYNEGVIYRNIYEVQAHVEPGDSGGTLLAPDGTVAGVVFAKSVTQDNIGYALLINQVQPLINKARQQNITYSTGSCTQ